MLILLEVCCVGAGIAMIIGKDDANSTNRYRPCYPAFLVAATAFVFTPVRQPSIKSRTAKNENTVVNFC